MFGGIPSVPTFQSTLPHGERPLRQIPGVLGLPFQSTLPHGERRQQLS